MTTIRTKILYADEYRPYQGGTTLLVRIGCEEEEGYNDDKYRPYWVSKSVCGKWRWIDNNGQEWFAEFIKKS